ncbi:unnamed protein product [Calypogeia fissa]
MMGVYASFKEAHNKNDVKAIMLTGAGGQFSGGVDIGAMQKRKATDSGANNKSPFMGVELMNDIFEVKNACKTRPGTGESCKLMGGTSPPPTQGQCLVV